MSRFDFDDRIKISLTEFFYKADKELNNLIIQENYQSVIVKKEIEYGDISKFTLNNHYIICYALTYTLFEDIENEYGERPNDIFMDVILTIDECGGLKLTRHIGSGFGEFDDIDYDDYIYDKKSFDDFLSQLNRMLDDFKNYFVEIMQELMTQRF